MDSILAQFLFTAAQPPDGNWWNLLLAPFMGQAGLWIGFNLFVLALLALDLGIFHRKAHEVSMREAAVWSVVWVALAVVFGLLIWQWKGPQVGLQFFTGYLIEKSLSVDNLFVFVLLFTFFAVPARLQHRVLFYGILGALAMRAVMILVGAVLIAKFHWIIYLFGGFLVLTGVKMALQKEEKGGFDQNPAVKLMKRLLPVTPGYHGERFLVKLDGKTFATPLLLVLVAVEFTDLVFAVDSIPAVFAVSTDPFIVYTSNVFAILGLRSLYFLLADVVHRFHYLKPALAVVLSFVGVKMLLAAVYKIPIGLSLGFIGLTLAVAIAASLWRERRLLAVDLSNQ